MRKTDGRNDSLVLEDGLVEYRQGKALIWSFAITELWLVGEWTNDHGPHRDDYFYFFIAGRPPRVFEAPMYANPGLLQQLGVSVGVGLEVGLASSTDFASRIIWPPELAGHPLFAYSPASRERGLWNQIKDQLFPLVQSQLTAEVVNSIRAQDAD